MTEEFDWVDLMFNLGDRQIVPVVGRELLTTTGPDGAQVSLEAWVVGKLLERFAAEVDDPDRLGPGMSLNEFTLAYMAAFPIDKREMRKRLVQKEITALLTSGEVEIPPALKKLAEIEAFDVFIATTPDTLLEAAVTAARGGCRVASYKLRSAPEDIDAAPTEPTVYHVFGRFDDNQDFAVTDEDIVEFLHSISSDAEPRNLLDYIGDKSLLLIGCGLSRTLVPSFVRTLANDRLFPSKSYRVVDKTFAEDPEILMFWHGFSGEALVSNDAHQFIDELHERWSSDSDGRPPPHPTDDDAKTVEPTPPAPGDRDDDASHVFVSYRRDDQPATDRIVDALRSRKINVWYDQTNIQGGDDWMREVETNIGNCLLFMPILSKNSQSDENVSIEEWNLALERRRKINKMLPFIIPVVIDAEIGPESDYIYPEFWEYDAKTYVDGAVDASFLDNVQAKVRERIKAKQR